ncbi:MAG: DUF4373 domain-containing protein [Clostridium sp.]|uniref:DUF4373 domain-containing protein n=1 Tax=Enterocloster aldenensis TaxID=358742 RepID=UPI00140AC1B7|nr:DUF4373 domain-containing protein [Clostridium sp.]
MAGKAKKKLDYAGWSVDIFDSDTKIDKLLDAQGWVGFSIYFYLCQRAFGSEGYFYRWGFDDCASTARKMGCGIGSGTVREAVGYCLQINLFDKRVFDRWGVLTSKGIQRSYWTVALGRRDKTVYKELWLLQNDECKGVVFVPFFEDMSGTNDHSQATNGDMSAANDPVVKESKLNSNKEEIVAPPPEPATFLPESFEAVCIDRLIKSILEQLPNAKVPGTNAERQKWAMEIERMQRLDKRSREQIKQALDYAIKSPFWRSNIRSAGKFREKFETLYLQSKERKDKAVATSPKNQFHNFDQRDTDYDALMLKQVREWAGEGAGSEGNTPEDT